MNNQNLHKMRKIRGVLIKFIILLIILITASCAVTSKHKYKKGRKVKPCDCPQFSRSSVDAEYAATVLFYGQTE